MTSCREIAAERFKRPGFTYSMMPSLFVMTMISVDCSTAQEKLAQGILCPIAVAAGWSAN